MNRILQVLVLVVLLFNSLSAFVIIHETDRTIRAATAQATNQGQIAFCINAPPSLSLGANCSANMTEHTLYTCQLNGSVLTHTFLSYFQIPQPPNTTATFNISPTGLINFTPNESDVGNHSTILGVDDNSHCDNAYAYLPFNFTVINVNDPPYLLRPIPDQTLRACTTLYAFFLHDYFADPDKGDVLNYSVIAGASEVQVNVTIENDSSVVFSGCQCGKAHYVFRATDLGGLFALSNIVTVEINCAESKNGGNTQGSGGAGGGGGGSESPQCKPELICLPWSECYPNGLQVQVCRDKNGCSNTELRFFQNCTYAGEQPRCQENWLCSEWGVCSLEGQQNRTCTDLNACQTTRTRPPLEQVCTYQPTCFDGVQNGNETGIDCGGPCPPCKIIQQPTPFAGARTATLLMLLAIIVLTVLLALFTLYRERVYEGLAQLGWLLARRREKELLLTPGEKRLLFEDFTLLDADLKKGMLAPQKAYERLAIVTRTYYSFVFDIPFEYTPAEYAKALAEAKLSDDLRELLVGFAGRLDLLESGLLPTKLQTGLFSTIEEELRLLICMTSQYDLAEMERELLDRAITPELSFAEEIRLRLLNGYEALQFLKLDIAEEQYLGILRAYENLPEQARLLLYPDIRRFYLEIAYVKETLAWTDVV